VFLKSKREGSWGDLMKKYILDNGSKNKGDKMLKFIVGIIS
jgi:hypothetical protein